MPEAVIAASIALDALLLRGDLAELKAAGIRFRSGTETAITRELRAIPIDRHHLIDHHYIAGRLKPSCWRPWADDPVGFPQARYLAALAPAPPATEETVNSYPVPKVPSIATVPAGTWLYATSALEPSPDNICVDPGRDMPYLGQPTSTVRIVEYVDAKGVHQGRAMFAKASEVTTIRPAPDPTPFSQAQLDAAAKTAAAAVKAAGIAPPRRSTGPERWRTSRFAVVLTAAGATASAALITGLIAILKQLVVIGPWIDAAREPTVAFVLSAVLVIVAVVSVGTFTAEALFAAFLAWFGIAQIAMGVHDTVKSATTGRAG